MPILEVNVTKFIGSITPYLDVYITFLGSNQPIIGLGKLKKKHGKYYFIMQMSTTSIIETPNTSMIETPTRL